jgi:hypothetical protein
MADHWDLPTQCQVRFTGPEWLQNLISNLSAHEASLVALLCWQIWFVRNEFKHNKKHIPCSTSAVFLQKYLAEMIKTQDSTPMSDVKRKSTAASRLIQKRSRPNQEAEMKKNGKPRLMGGSKSMLMVRLRRNRS